MRLEFNTCFPRCTLNPYLRHAGLLRFSDVPWPSAVSVPAPTCEMPCLPIPFPPLRQAFQILTLGTGSGVSSLYSSLTQPRRHTLVLLGFPSQTTSCITCLQRRSACTEHQDGVSSCFHPSSLHLLVLLYCITDSTPMSTLHITACTLQIVWSDIPVGQTELTVKTTVWTKNVGRMDRAGAAGQTHGKEQRRASSP